MKGWSRKREVRRELNFSEMEWRVMMSYKMDQ